MDLPLSFVILLACSLGILGLLLMVLRRSELADQRVRSIVIYLTLSLFWLGLLAAIQLFPLQSIVVSLSVYLWIFSSLAFVFTGRLITQSKGKPLGWFFLVALWLATLIAFDLRILPQFLGSITRLAVLLAGGGLLHAGILFLILRARRSHLRPEVHNQINYWTTAWLFLLLADGLYWLGQIANSPLSSWSHILRLIAAALTASALTVRRLPYLRYTFHRLLTYTLFSSPVFFLLVASYLLQPLAQRYLPGVGPLALAFLTSLALIWLIIATWRRLPQLVNRLVPLINYDPNRILREYSLGISNISNLETLAKIAVSFICEAIEIQNGYLFNVEYGAADEVYHLRGIGGKGKEKPEDGQLSETNPIVQTFKLSHRPLTIYDLEISPELLQGFPAERLWFKQLELEVFVPIYTKDDWIGVLALGQKSSGASYQESDLTLIITLADQTSIALKNARLVESLMRLNNEFRRAYTALEQSNRQLQQALNQLQKLDQTKSDFISIASHELRTPLTVMRGYNEMLMEDSSIQTNDYHQKLVKGIHSGMMRMSEVIETMLDMASIDSRSLVLHKEQVSLNSVIHGLEERFENAFKERNITFTMENLRDLPNLEADDEALFKVFTQLVTNAIKYTPDHGTITVTGVMISPGQANFPDGGVEIIVADSGIGINPEALEVIFTKFYQTGELSLHSTGKTKFKGAGPGLGLAIAKGIVEAHGGKIWAESTGYDEVNCPGSQFHVILPLHH